MPRPGWGRSESCWTSPSAPSTCRLPSPQPRPLFRKRARDDRLSSGGPVVHRRFGRRLLDRGDPPGHAGRAAVGLAAADSFAVGRLEDEIRLPAGPLFPLEARSVTRVLADRLDPLLGAALVGVALAGQDDPSVARLQIEVELPVTRLLDLELSSHVDLPENGTS